MAAKEFKVTVPHPTVKGRVITRKVMANSAEQAARRVEREEATGRAVDQKRHISNVTRKQAV